MLLLAQTVGFEPTWHCCQIDFESISLRPLRYVCLFSFYRTAPHSVLEKCEISMQDNDEKLGTQHPIKPAVIGFPADKVTCRMQTFESSTSRYSSYISLFRFALKRLFSVLTLVFDILTYFVLYVARGCLGNIWATIVFRATLFGTTQGKLKICTEFEDLAIFQSKSFFFVWRFYREKHKFCC